MMALSSCAHGSYPIFTHTCLRLFTAAGRHKAARAPLMIRNVPERVQVVAGAVRTAAAFVLENRLGQKARHTLEHNIAKAYIYICTYRYRYYSATLPTTAPTNDKQQTTYTS